MGIRKDLLAGAPISVEKHTSRAPTIVAVSYKPFYVPSKYFERNAGRKNGAGKVKGKIFTLVKRKPGGEEDSCRTDAPQLR
jgi:hypothetical protein